MIVGCGVDIVENRRFERWIEKPEMVSRFFGADELSGLDLKKDKALESLAVRFAAKEAFGKALGIGLKFELSDVQVKKNPAGKPDLVLSGTALKVFEENGGKKIHLSLSHEKEYSVAMVVVEG